MGSELLEKLTRLDSRADELVAAARQEAEKTAGTLAARIAELEAGAEKAMEAKLDKRSAELASEREQLLARIEAEKRIELEAISKVPESRIDQAAGAVVARLLEE